MARHTRDTRSHRASKARRGPARARSSPRYWSAAVTERSNALDLAKGLFTLPRPAQIARSLKRSADRSRRRKSSSFRSALSMLTFYVNRAGKNLSDARRAVLQRAKNELRRMYGR